MDSKESEKQALLKQFYRNYPKYLKGKKVLFPIMDECLIQYSSLFSQSKHQGRHPEGRPISVFTTVPVNQLLEITTFANSFPTNYSFDQLSESRNMGSQFFTPFMRLVCQTLSDYHTINSFGKINLYSTNDSQEQLDRLNFKILSFLIEDLFKYKLNILQPKDILKQRVVDVEQTKKEKKQLKQKVSLLNMMETQKAQAASAEDLRKDELLEQLQFENMLDPTCSTFWSLVYETFTVCHKKLAKLAVKFEDQPPPQSSVHTKYPIDPINILLRRKQQIRNYTNLKLKECTKVQNRAIQQIKNLKHIDGMPLSSLEQQRFGKLFKFFLSSWPEFLIQISKIPYARSIFPEAVIDLVAKLKEDPDGYHKFTTKERAQLISLISEAAVDTEAYRQLTDYRHELVNYLGDELEEVGKVLEELNALKSDQDQSLVQEYRRVYKHYLQLVEFPRLFLNGAQYLGSDINSHEYFIFAHDAMHLYATHNHEWRQLEMEDVQQLTQVLNVHGVKERELLSNIQKLQACELLGDQDSANLLKPPAPPELRPNTGLKSVKALIQRSLREAEQKLTKTLMVKHLRWEGALARQQFHETVDACDQMRQFSTFMVLFIQQLTQVQQLKLNPSKLAVAKFSDQEFKTIGRMLGESQIEENMVFENYQIFLLMEREHVVVPNGLKQKLQFWQLSLGEKVKNYFMALADKVSDDAHYQILFMANLLLLAVEEFSFGFLQGEQIIEDDNEEPVDID